MKHGDKQHKEAWIKHVANTLGFDALPQDVLCKVEIMYERGWTAPEAIENIKKFLNIVPNDKA